MRIARIFYADDLKVNLTVALNVRTCHYLLHVLRLKERDELILFNGDGTEYHAQIIHIEKKVVRIHIDTSLPCHTESPLFIELGQGISRSEKMDYVIQKAVELGVNRIVPLFTSRCGVKFTEKRLANRMKHWHSVLISACEQSGRCRLPELLKPQPLNEWLILKRTGLNIVCDLNSTQSLANTKQTIQRVTVLIGPEGGLTMDEINQAKNVDFADISLGPRVLRTETAAVTTLSLLQAWFGDL